METLHEKAKNGVKRSLWWKYYYILNSCMLCKHCKIKTPTLFNFISSVVHIHRTKKLCEKHYKTLRVLIMKDTQLQDFAGKHESVVCEPSTLNDQVLIQSFKSIIMKRIANIKTMKIGSCLSMFYILRIILVYFR